MSDKLLIHCSFCKKDQEAVSKIIVGPDRIAICNECIGLCAMIMFEESVGSKKRIGPFYLSTTPFPDIKEIVREVLNEQAEGTPPEPST